MENYWNVRYKGEEGSGSGSYGKYREFIQQTIHQLRIPIEKTTLDYGCGDRMVWEGFEFRDNKYTGLDLSSVIINKNKEKYSQFKFLLVDELEDMYDVAFCISVIFHLLTKESLDKVLTDLATHTSDTIVIGHWAKEPVKYDTSHQKYWDIIEWKKILEIYGWVWHKQIFSKHDDLFTISIFKLKEVKL